MNAKGAFLVVGFWFLEKATLRFVEKRETRNPKP
jgi:hypothetical protein